MKTYKVTRKVNGEMVTLVILSPNPQSVGRLADRAVAARIAKGRAA
jgi:hypothetical protein